MFFGIGVGIVGISFIQVIVLTSLFGGPLEPHMFFSITLFNASQAASIAFTLAALRAAGFTWRTPTRRARSRVEWV
jgi:hypothetical protein